MQGYEAQAAALSPHRDVPAEHDGQSKIWKMGYRHGVAQARGGVANITSDPLTRAALDKAASATDLNVDDLWAMAIIESTGNRHVGTNGSGYTGLMHMGKAAARDVGMSYGKMQGASNVDYNALAGAKFWQRNDELLDESVPRDPLHMYLAHQQGGGGTNTLMRDLQTRPNAAAKHAQRVNLPPEVRRAMGGTVTRQNFYDYWAGKMTAIRESIAAHRQSER